MISLRRSLPTLALLVVLATPAAAQSPADAPPATNPSAAPPSAPPAWPVTSAPARLDIVPTRAPEPSRLGVVDLFLPDPNWLNMPIRVYTDAGVAVGSDLVWNVPNGPATLAFDASLNAKKYQVYFGSNYPAIHVADTKAGVWFESRVGDGQYPANLPDMLKAWNQSTKVIGRAVVDGMWEGGNRFGPQANLLTHLQGWFDLTAPTHLDFAIVAVDSSFVLIDGKQVVAWPGHHERWYGPAGPPHGGIDLAAGPHVVDYYNDYVYEGGDGPPPLTFSLVVKGGRFPNWTMVMPNAHFFRPFFHGATAQYELQKDIPGAATTGSAPALALSWDIRDQSVIYTDLADTGFISVRFDLLVPPKGTVTWTFDDGTTTVESPGIEHLFLRPGLRTVHVSLTEDGKETASLTQTVYIHPDWPRPARVPALLPQHEANALSRNPAALSASDLAGCFAIFSYYLATDDLLKFLPAVVAKMNDVADADLPYIKSGALLLSREDWVHYAEETQLLRALVDRCGKGTPTPAVAAIGSQARLALARLLYRSSDKLDDVKALIAGIDPQTLTDREPRILQILNADLALASGDLTGARKQYTDLTGEPTGPDARSSIRQMAKIGQARAYIDRKDFDAAEDALNEVAWQNPIEKISSDWALTRLRLYQEEGLPVLAYTWARRLLPVITDGGRAELLYRTTDLAFSQNDSALANKTLAELLSKHPYSEEAAQAKQKWPASPQPPPP